MSIEVDLIGREDEATLTFNERQQTTELRAPQSPDRAACNSCL